MTKNSDAVEWTRGDWFQTDSGVRFYPYDPKEEDILIEDIVHALSRICRFGGHCQDFYSVAQHSCLVSDACPREFALEGLMHDASEAYLGDVIRPIKIGLNEYMEMEKNLEALIAKRFHLKFPFPPEIKAADNAALFTERRDLLRVSVPWPHQGVEWVRRIEPWSVERAEREFWNRLYALTPSVAEMLPR